MCITCRSNVGEHTLSKVGDTLGSTNRLVPETAPLPQRNTIFASQIGESHFFFFLIQRIQEYKGILQMETWVENDLCTWVMSR